MVSYLVATQYCTYNQATVTMSSYSAGNLGFYLNGFAYPNGSTVLRTDIGEGDAALLCTTDSTTCCSNMNGEVQAGEFYFPNGSAVPIMGDVTDGYYRNRSSQLILLNRQQSGVITGQFRCEIPDACGKNATLFISICMSMYYILHHISHCMQLF